jgi:hypothetical protein
MPLDLLAELEAATPPPPEQLEHTDQLLQVFQQIVQRVNWGVEHCKGSVVLFERIWRTIVAAVAEGRMAEVQATREPFLKAVEDRLRVLKTTHTQATKVRAMGIPGTPDPAVLLPELAGMEKLKTRVCDRWQTADDVEDLAARDYPLTTADLDRIGPKHRPPASWYSEEGKPF